MASPELAESNFEQPGYFAHRYSAELRWLQSKHTKGIIAQWSFLASPQVNPSLADFHETVGLASVLRIRCYFSVQIAESVLR